MTQNYYYYYDYDDDDDDDYYYYNYYPLLAENTIFHFCNSIRINVLEFYLHEGIVIFSYFLVH